MRITPSPERIHQWLLIVGAACAMLYLPQFLGLYDVRLERDGYRLLTVAQRRYPVRVDRSHRGGALLVAGQRYHKGLGCHATSRVRLEATGSIFQGAVGVDDAAGPRGKVEFVIRRGQQVLFRSGPMRRGDPAKLFHFAIQPGSVLTLTVRKLGRAAHDHANWLSLASF